MLAAFVGAAFVAAGVVWAARHWLGVERELWRRLISIGTFVLSAQLFRWWWRVPTRVSPYSEPASLMGKNGKDA